MPVNAEIVVLGDINVDVVASCRHLPRRGHCVRPDGLAVHAGGAAANTAHALARLGRRVALLGRVGADPWAETPLCVLRQAGVDLQHVQHDSEIPTGLIYTTVTPDGARTTLAYQGANTRHHLDPGAAAAIATARLLHLTGYAFLAEPQRTAAREAMAVARDHSVAITLDPSVTVPPTAVAELRSMLGGLAAVLPNRVEAERLTGELEPHRAAASLAASFGGLVAVKLGASGCMLARPGESVAVPGFAVATVDATGAGDAFDAAILTGLLEGTDMPTLGILGNACGALTASAAGAAVAAPTLSLLAQFLARHRHGELPPDALVCRAEEVVGCWAARVGLVATSANPVYCCD